MSGTYDGLLVAFSILIAVVASFVTLQLAARVVAAQGNLAEWI
jgi:NO-binding membrane sensor protein with MHYT domain